MVVVVVEGSRLLQSRTQSWRASDRQLLQIKRKTDETISLELQSLRDMQTRVFSQFSDQIHDLLKASSLGNEKLDGIERRLEALMKGSLPPQQERGGEVDDDQLIALAKEMAAALGKDAVVVASQRGEAAIEPRHARSQTSTTVITTDLPVVGEAQVTIAATTVLRNPTSAHPLLSGEIRTLEGIKEGNSNEIGELRASLKVMEEEKREGGERAEQAALAAEVAARGGGGGSGGGEGESDGGEGGGGGGRCRGWRRRR